MPIAVIILFFTLLAIALRRMVRVIIPIWLIMTCGAFAALLLQQITPLQAIHAIEPEVIIYLFGVFFIAQAAEECGYLEQLTDTIFHYAHTGKQALLIIVFVLGPGAALLMNDTIAIIGTPIIIQLCRSQKNLSKPLLFALAFSITIGSTISPVGNPQNLLIAVKGEMTSPFWDFIRVLVLPTLLNLGVCYWWISLIYQEILDKPFEKISPRAISDPRTKELVKISLGLMCGLILIKIITDFFAAPLKLNFSYIALISALPIVFSHHRITFLKKLDWGTLIFFASTFVLMESVWNSGFLQNNIEHWHIPLTHFLMIWIISMILSQFISNVALVALYLPLLIHHGGSNMDLLTLAVGSTLAGNLSILGAASNIIIIQNSEKRGVRSFGFMEFIKLGLPLTLINSLIYMVFIRVLGGA